MKTYNGWTNYATWSINLEMLDGYEHTQSDAYDLSNEIQEYVVSYIDETTPDGLAKDYALAFISEVNWYEIAQHLISEME